jgi:hypothetical protein
MIQSIDASAGGAFLGGGASGLTKGLAGARLVAAAATALAVIRETNGSGRILATLSAVANTSDDFEPQAPIAFTGNVHVTLTGAGAQLNLFED